MAGELTIQGADGLYPVLIRPGLLNDALPALVAERGFTRIAIVANTTLAPLYGQALAERLPGAFLVTVPDGEPHKTVTTLLSIYTQLLAAGADRSSLIIALGGGVIGDMAGLAAATFMRGVAFLQAPTSLLAMVDASIGGKVGVDLPQGKNLIGAFKDPIAVLADTSTLATLPAVEFRCGLAEVVKSALVGDPLLLAHLQKHGSEPVEEIIRRAVAVKKQIVEQDRLETGARAFLNLGHTFAHAIEQVSGYTWKHGAAVAVGLAAAARLSVERGLCAPDLAPMVEQLIAALGLPVRFSGLDARALWAAMQHDKKWRDGAARFVLLERVGSPVIVSGVRREEVFAVLEKLREKI